MLPHAQAWLAQSKALDQCLCTVLYKSSFELSRNMGLGERAKQ